MVTMTQKQIKLFRLLIRERLAGKTAWGRRQVLTEIEAALTDALMGVEPAE